MRPGFEPGQRAREEFLKALIKRPMTAGQIMKLFGISKSTCYYLLKELVEKGLIKKTGYKPAIYSITLSKNFIENLGKEKVGVHNIKVVCYLHEVNLHKVVFFLYYLIKIKGKDREEETETNKKKSYIQSYKNRIDE
ncbi:MAG: hypothetical protein DRO98_06790 [Archaeoglobales archaeon]|nr:MAG: hypothetical protein DRO98_06790 [Archaeoglobales archaeon]